jgi:hypothetical protein
MSAGTFLINNYYEMTLDTPLTLASGQSVWVEITGGNPGGSLVFSAETTFDTP